MAVSRPVLLGLLGAVLIAALYFATLGMRSAGDDSGAPATPPSGKALSPAAKGKATAAKGKATATKSSAGPTKPSAAAKRSAAPDARARATDAPPAAAKPQPAPKPAAPAGVPAGVTRALARKQTVVLFFYQRGSADDDATAQAVASVRGRRGVKVFSAPITRLADYRAVTGGAGVSQAPAVVILGHRGAARLIEGYIDRETLAQEVADAR